MAKNGMRRIGMADPTRLHPRDVDDHKIIQVIIKTPKGSRNKYAFDLEQRIFALKKVLPASMAFPYDLDLYRQHLRMTAILSTCWPFHGLQHG